MAKTFAILKDAADFAAFNKAYAEYFDSDHPARTTLEAKPMIDIEVEVEAVAYKPL